MAIVIAIANQKGGVGKSTTAHNLAYSLASRGKKVLAIDNDLEGSLTVCFGENPDELEKQQKTLYFSLVGDKPLSALIVGENPALIASSMLHATAETELITNALLGGASSLRDRLAEVRARFDFVLIDCPPSLGMLTLNGLSAADAVLIPVKTEYLSANGVVLFLETVRKVRARQNPRLRILGVLPTEFHSTHTHDNEVLQVLQTLLAEQGIPIFEPVNASTAFRKASAAGQPAVVLTPDLAGAQSYYKLADKIIAYATER